MTLTIRQWLEQISGVDMLPVKIHLKNQLSDGMLIAKVLHYYNIITYDDMKIIEPTYDSTISYWNYLLINTWLRKIGIVLSTKEILDIIRGDGDVGARFLMKLFKKFTVKESESMDSFV